ncbi:hypothetical protein ACETRX_22280 [Labrys portucalensis]|uniref:Uncharacterized protein n=1 Tax=Labrys neptuniae TaxID=376174 RepID=A0ABV6ZJN8_9HYPH
MTPVSLDTIYATVDLLGAQEHYPDDGVEERIRHLVNDDLTMHRLADVIPEAFGLVLISHIPAASGVSLPTCFYAQDDQGGWQPFPFNREPIFAVAIEIAQHVFHNGPRHVMKNIADRSGLLATIGNALDQGGSLGGSTLHGPRFFGLPASLYEPIEGAPPHRA